MSRQKLYPVSRSVLLDGETALACFRKLANTTNTFLFESVQGSEKWARYSFIGLPSREVYTGNGNLWCKYIDGECVSSNEVADPLAEIESLLADFSVQKDPSLPRFTGGLVGYCGYDVCRFVEPRLARQAMNPDPIGTPDIYLMLCRELVVYDNLRNTVILITHYDETGSKAHACKRLDEIEAMLQQPIAPMPPLALDRQQTVPFEAHFTKQDFKDAVDTIKQHIFAGDVFQAVPSQRMSLDFTDDPLQLYRALRYINPSPYMYHLQLDDFAIVGSSPEVMARLEDGEITVRPLAGSMPRGSTPEQDALHAQQLLADEKEVAEHVMLIDLARNDIGRIAQPGSVQVHDQLSIEYYSHVMHIVSNVSGQLADGLSCVDVIRATMPAGTLCGAPKIRAMEIINDLEQVKRGIYSGAVGYFDWHGNVDTAIPIRTAIIRQGKLHIQAGCGIVADSNPEREWQETITKRQAMFRAIGMVINAQRK